MKNNECKIIQDLLPNYVEKLTSNETNILVEEHLKECKNCSNILFNMQKDLEKQNSSANTEISYAKKYNMKYKKIKYSLIIIILSLTMIILAFFGRNAIICRSIASKMEKHQDATNYYLRKYNYIGSHYVADETWVKDGKMYTSYYVELFKNIPSVLVKDNKVYYYTIDYENGERIVEREVTDLTADMITPNGALKFYFWDLIEMLKGELRSISSIFKYSIRKTVVNGTKCYQFSSKNQLLYFDIETGLIIRWEILDGAINNSGTENEEVQSTLYDYMYKFDCVTDEDIIEPNKASDS